MQHHINDLISNRQSTTTPQDGQKTYSRQEAEQAEEVMNDLFNRLQAVCTAWKQAYSSQDAYQATKAEWLKSFLRNGINDVDLIDEAVDLVKLSGKDFFPTVGSFIKLYKKAALQRSGAPETAKAYRTLTGYLQIPRERRQPWNLHPYIYATIKDPAFDLMSFNLLGTVNGKDLAKEKFNEIYMTVVDRALAGEVIRGCAPPDRQLEDKPNPSGVSHYGKKDLAKNTCNELLRGLK